MFNPISGTIKLPKELKRVESYRDLKRIFKIEKLLYNFTCVPKKLVYDISISCEAKIFWAVLHQLCGLGCSYYKQADLAKITGVTVRMIQYYTKQLKDNGWLQTERNDEDNRKIEYITKSSNIFVAILNKYLFDFSVSTKAKALWLVLQELGDESGCSWYSQDKLAKHCGWKDKETLKKYRDELEKTGLLEIKSSKVHRSKDLYVIWPKDRPNPKQISAMRKSKAGEKRKR